MKKINKNILHVGVLASALAVSGCSDSFLEQEPPKQATVDTYFTTEEHIEEALASVYVPAFCYDYNTIDGYSPLNFSDILGDDFLTGAGGPTDQRQWHMAFDYILTGEETLHNYWAVSYDGIKAACEAISYVEKNKEKLSEAFCKRVIAEAQVMRSFYYSIVWKWYGNIPFFTEPLGAEGRAPQLKADDAYAAIIKDLEDVIATKSLPMYQNDENLGRASQAMAYMIYAELVMYQNDNSRFATALKYMNEIINDGHYNLNPDFAAVWTPEGEWCEESIWEINYTDGPLCVRGYEGAEGQIGGTWLPRVSGPDVPTDDPDVMTDSWGTYIPRRTAMESFEEGDLRIPVTFLEADTEGDKTKRYQQQSLFQNKYIPRKSHIAEGTGGADHCRYNDNFRVYRFSETLLNAAELIVRGAGSGDAVALVNKVRTRAGISELSSVTIDDIIEERRHEFCGEGKRYWDLVRMEDVAEATIKASTVLVPEAQPVNTKGDPGRSKSWKKGKKYIPIQQTEISAAQGGLVQNNEYFN